MEQAAATVSYATVGQGDARVKRRYLRLWVGTAVVLAWQVGMWLWNSRGVELDAQVYDKAFYMRLLRGWRDYWYFVNVNSGWSAGGMPLELGGIRVRMDGGPGGWPFNVSVGVHALVVVTVLALLTVVWRRRYLREARLCGGRGAAEQMRDVGEVLATPTRVAVLAAFCWLGMMWVHEAGHVIACFLSAGSVERVVLSPWGFSRTDVWVDPHPLVTVWGGPVLGAAVPAVAAWLYRRECTLRLFAAFCLLANGAYVFFGSFEGAADAGVMLRRGSPAWALWGFGILAMAGAVGVARTLGPRLGFGRGGDGGAGRYGWWETVAAGVLAVGMGVVGAVWFGE